MYTKRHCSLSLVYGGVRAGVTEVQPVVVRVWWCVDWSRWGSRSAALNYQPRGLRAP